MNAKLKKTTLALAAALALGASGAASAFSITNTDGTFDFGGFDWSAQGQGWVSDYDITNASPLGTVDSFTLRYQASAVALKDSGGINFTPTSMSIDGGVTGSYEYTIFVTITETATCVTDLPGGGTCDLVLFSIGGGSYSIYYDLTADSDYAAGTGFTDGTLLIGGSIVGGTPVTAFQGATNPGDASVSPSATGNVTFQNLAFLAPSIDQTIATSTLQFGSAQTPPWARAAAFDGIATGPDSNTSYQGQMDGNQSFTNRVPEPGSLVLLGIGLVGLGAAGRRRLAK